MKSKATASYSIPPAPPGSSRRLAEEPDESPEVAEDTTLEADAEVEADVVLDESFEDEDDEESGDALQVESTDFGSLPPPRPKAEESAGDSMLGRYFREMSSHPILGPEEELEAAIAVERAEIEHWQSLFVHVPAALHVLHALEEELPVGEGALDLPQLDELRALLGKSKNGKLTKPAQRRYDALVLALATAVRLPDTDRLWLTRCEEAARHAADAPLEESVYFTDDTAERASVDESHVQLVRRPQPIERSAAYEAALAHITQANHQASAVKNRFVKANLRLVVSIARRYNRGRLPLIDLIQEGNIGLMKAVERFDHARGYRFSTYASWWIRHAISRAIADKGRAVRIPVHMLDTHNRVLRATQNVIARTGREPTPAELERETGIPQDKLSKVKGNWAETPFSLDRAVGDEDGRRFVDFLQDEQTLSPHESLLSQKWTEEVRRLLQLLTPIESRIIRWRFGLDDEDELTLKEIGEKYNLSRERIRQLQEQALHKIRRQMRDY